MKVSEWHTSTSPHVMLSGRCKLPDTKITLFIVDDKVSIRTSLPLIPGIRDWHHTICAVEDRSQNTSNRAM